MRTLLCCGGVFWRVVIFFCVGVFGFSSAGSISAVEQHALLSSLVAVRCNRGKEEGVMLGAVVCS
jgi:hypothetical protein